MKQAVMEEPGVIRIRDVEKPQPENNEVLVHVRRIGICGSDIHVYHGKHPYTDYPVVQGHEVSGVVAAVGSGVTGVSIGDKVTFQPQLTCGRCFSCTHGMPHICNSLKVMGFQTDGAAQEYFVVPQELILTLPECISLDSGAMVEPAAVAVHALRRSGNVRDKRIVVFGAGTIGNLVAQVAGALGAESVMISDLSGFRLQVARECGIEYTVDARTETVAARILEEYGQDRADLILECVGAQETIGQAIDSARKGSTIVVVGVFGSKPQVDLGLVQDRELNLIGSLMYRREDYELAVELMRRGTIDVSKLITDTFSFENYLEAYRYIDKAGDRAMKVMITLD